VQYATIIIIIIKLDSRIIS